VTTTNPGGTVRLVGATPEQVSTVFAIAPNAAIGPTTVTVTTALGSASIDFTVVQRPPVLAQLTPDTAVAGAAVSLAGQYLDAIGASPVVTFAGTGGTRIAATLSAPPAPTTLNVTVPPGTVTGDVTVAVGVLTSNALHSHARSPP
jgi:hypothetical protein